MIEVESAEMQEVPDLHSHTYKVIGGIVNKGKERKRKEKKRDAQYCVKSLIWVNKQSRPYSQ